MEPRQNPLLSATGITTTSNSLLESAAAKHNKVSGLRIVVTAKHRVLDARRMKRAIEHIGRLPDREEVIHLISAESYTLMHLIRAVLQLAHPATFENLVVSTLGFSRENIYDLTTMLKNGTAKNLTLIYSAVFRAKDKEQAADADEITRLGGSVVACRCHAKIAAMLMTDGRAFVTEGSANLRSCSSIEQLIFTQSRPLYDFHTGWLLELRDDWELKMKRY